MGENQPRPQNPCFSKSNNFFRESDEGSPRKIHVNLLEIKRADSEMFNNFIIYHKVKISPNYKNHVFQAIKIP